MLYDTHHQKLHPLLKYQYFFSLTSGPSHNCHGPYFLEMAHNFWKPGAIGPYACSAFPISGKLTFSVFNRRVEILANQASLPHVIGPLV